jgi:hypothetical protein
MSPRILSTQKLSDVAKIWEEAERRLGASRANFSLVRSGSRYVPPDGILDPPEQLFEIRWRGRGGSPRFQLTVVVEGVTRLEMADESLTLKQLFRRIEWNESSDQVVDINDGPKFRGEIWHVDDLPLIRFFEQCAEGPKWAIELYRGPNSDDYWVDDRTEEEWLAEWNSPQDPEDIEAQRQVDQMRRAREAAAVAEIEKNADSEVGETGASMSVIAVHGGYRCDCAHEERSHEANGEPQNVAGSGRHSIDHATYGVMGTVFQLGGWIIASLWPNY